MIPDPVEARLVAALGAGGSESSDFDLNPNVVLAADRTLKPAAVLVGVLDGRSGPEVLLTKRSSRLRHHPGQIAFPGGKCDDSDANAEAAALREAHEEVGLPADAVRVLGRLPCHETVTGFQVVPIVARIVRPFDPTPEEGEVAEVFSAPLSHVCDPGQFRIEGRRWRGQRRQYFTVPYGPYYIWGATARILKALAERIIP